MLLDLISERDDLRGKLLIHPAHLTQLDQRLLCKPHRPIELGVCTQRVGQHVSVSRIIFGTRDAMPISLHFFAS